MAETFLVQFSNVGARKLTWEERLPRPVNGNQIVAAVRRKGALMSRDIDADFGDSDYRGTIYVGGLRPVGRFLIVPSSNAVAQSGEPSQAVPPSKPALSVESRDE